MNERDQKLTPEEIEREKRQAREIRAMMRVLGWDQSEAAEHLEETSKSQVSQALSRERSPDSLWHRLMLVLVGTPGKLREALMEAGREEGGQGGQELRDAPAWPPWAAELLNDLAELPAARRKEWIESARRMLYCGKPVSSGDLAKAEEATAVARAREEQRAQERTAAAGGPSPRGGERRSGGSRGTNPRPGAEGKDR